MARSRHEDALTMETEENRLAVEQVLLAPETPISVSPVPDENFNPAAQLAQLTRLLSAYTAMGLVHQRPDGSFALPGQQSSQADREIQERGSECVCPMCSPVNQRHWRCVICLHQHEWVIQRPKASWPMGVIGRGGMKLFAVDTDACAREFLQRQGRAPEGSIAPAQGLDRPVPIAGGDDGYGFFVQGAPV